MTQMNVPVSGDLLGGQFNFDQHELSSLARDPVCLVHIARA